MVIGGREFVDSGKTYVMAILNVTPDSFSDGGRFNEMDRALWHVEEMIGDGMDILDIGGESTRPGYTLLSEEEETSRVAPVIEAVKKRFDVPVSLDTYKYKVAQAGIAAGADLINDIWGLKYDGGQMAETIAGSGLPCCLMHNRQNADYGNFLEDLAADLADTLRIAEAAGIRDDKIILDPGVGFGKTYENNLTADDVGEIEQINPEILLLCGGIEGGNTDRILHNARMLKRADVSSYVVYAGNQEIASYIRQELVNSSISCYIAENVFPAYGQLNGAPAGEIIRQLFMERIVGAKGLASAFSSVG